MVVENVERIEFFLGHMLLDHDGAVDRGFSDVDRMGSAIAEVGLAEGRKPKIKLPPGGTKPQPKKPHVEEDQHIMLTTTDLSSSSSLLQRGPPGEQAERYSPRLPRVNNHRHGKNGRNGGAHNDPYSQTPTATFGAGEDRGDDDEFRRGFGLAERAFHDWEELPDLDIEDVLANLKGRVGSSSALDVRSVDPWPIHDPNLPGYGPGPSGSQPKNATNGTFPGTKSSRPKRGPHATVLAGGRRDHSAFGTAVDVVTNPDEEDRRTMLTEKKTSKACRSFRVCSQFTHDSTTRTHSPNHHLPVVSHPFFTPPAQITPITDEPSCATQCEIRAGLGREARFEGRKGIAMCWCKRARGPNFAPICSDTDFVGGDQDMVNTDVAGGMIGGWMDWLVGRFSCTEDFKEDACFREGLLLDVV